MGWFSAAASIGGAIIGGISSSNAAETAADASIEAAKIYAEQQEKARQEFREAAQRGIEAIRAGTQGYRSTINPMLGSPDRLTPAQEIARQDLQRGGRATLAASGLRGAGRAGVGQLLDADRRFLADAWGANQARGDQARSGLANIYAQEGGAIANTEIGAGNQIGQSLTSQGAMSAQAARDAGLYQAGSIADQGQLWGSALGTLGSVMADEIKRASAGTPPRA